MICGATDGTRLFDDENGEEGLGRLAGVPCDEDEDAVRDVAEMLDMIFGAEECLLAFSHLPADTSLPLIPTWPRPVSAASRSRPT
jgi:hypothetical protein